VKQTDKLKVDIQHDGIPDEGFELNDPEMDDDILVVMMMMMMMIKFSLFSCN